MEAVFRSFHDIKRIQPRAKDRSQRQFLNLKRLERNHPSNISLSDPLLRMHNKKPTHERIRRYEVKVANSVRRTDESLDRATGAKTPKVQLVPEESQIPQGACSERKIEKEREKESREKWELSRAKRKI